MLRDLEQERDVRGKGNAKTVRHSFSQLRILTQYLHTYVPIWVADVLTEYVIPTETSTSCS